MKLPSDLANKHFIPFADGCLLFDEIEQSVLILNQTAAFIWCASFEADSNNELTAMLANNFAISNEQAREDIEQFYTYAQKSRLFLFVEDKLGSFLTAVENTLQYPSCSNKLPRLSFSVYHNTFNLSVPNAALRSELVNIYSHFIHRETDPLASDVGYTIDVCADSDFNNNFFSIYINGQCVARGLLLENVVPYIFGIIFETTWRSQLTQNSTHTLMFHAAVLARGGSAVLFPAESGAGKSTLAAVLASRGWQFFTDELAIIDPERLSVSPCPLAISVKTGAVGFLSAYYPQLKSLKQYHRLDNKRVRYLPVASSELDFSIQRKIGMFIFPVYNRECNKETSCELQLLPKREALSRFLNCGSSGRPLNSDELTAIVAMIEQLPCYALNYSDIDKAIMQIESILPVV